MLEVLLLAWRDRAGYTPAELIASIPDRLAHYRNPNNWKEELVGFFINNNGFLELDIRKVYKGYA